MKITITKKFEFEAAHHLEGYDGPCKHIHGHSYKLFVTVRKIDKIGEEPDMVMDFSELKKIVQYYILDVFDHTNLDRYFHNINKRPTAENMVRVFYGILESRLPWDTKITKLQLFETEGSSAELCV